MTGIFSEVLGAIDHKSLASEEIDTVRDTLRVYLLSCAFFEVFRLFKANRILHTSLEHLSRFLTQRRVFVVVWLEVFFPNVFHELGHCKNSMIMAEFN